MAKLRHGPLWIPPGHLRDLVRDAGRVERRPERAASPLDLARRVFLLAALGILAFVTLAIVLTGV